MGSNYNWNINPFQNYLFRSILSNIDISNKEIEVDIYVEFATILKYFLPDDRFINYLDFEIKNNNGHYKVVAKNAISALWISGIFPKSPASVLKTNEFVLEDIKYKFNPKTNKLIHQLIKK